MVPCSWLASLTASARKVLTSSALSGLATSLTTRAAVSETVSMLMVAPRGFASLIRRSVPNVRSARSRVAVGCHGHAVHDDTLLRDFMERDRPVNRAGSPLRSSRRVPGGDSQGRPVRARIGGRNQVIPIGRVHDDLPVGVATGSHPAAHPTFA